MKFSLIALSLCVLGVSCERHDFEETKQLHQSHGSHSSHDAGHGDDHGSEKKAEGEKPAH